MTRKGSLQYSVQEQPSLAQLHSTRQQQQNTFSEYYNPRWLNPWVQNPRIWRVNCTLLFAWNLKTADFATNLSAMVCMIIQDTV